MYNEMMRKRHGFLQLARHRIKKRVQQDKFWVSITIAYSMLHLNSSSTTSICCGLVTCVQQIHNKASWVEFVRLDRRTICRSNCDSETFQATTENVSVHLRLQRVMTCLNREFYKHFYLLTNLLTYFVSGVVLIRISQLAYGFFSLVSVVFGFSYLYFVSF